MSDRVEGFHPGGRKAFSSANLRGLADYSRKHGVEQVKLGMCITGQGLYTVAWDDGVTCKGSFASPAVMLGYFLNRTWCNRIDCERHTFNQGADSPGRLQLARLTPLDRQGATNRLGRWTYGAYRDATHTPMVRFISD